MKTRFSNACPTRPRARSSAWTAPTRQRKPMTTAPTKCSFPPQPAAAPKRSLTPPPPAPPAKADDYSADEVLFSAATGSSAETLPDADTPGSAADEPDWGGDGSVEMAPSDAEWGGDAPASQRNDAEGDGIEATELAQSEESLAAFLHRQALALRLSEIDRAALYFLIESLNDDGYLEDSLEELAGALAGPQNPEQIEELVHRFTVAQRLLQSLEPVGVGARNLAECLTLQLNALAREREPAADPQTVQTALRICQQPLQMLARRDLRRLTQVCGDSQE